MFMSAKDNKALVTLSAYLGCLRKHFEVFLCRLPPFILINFFFFLFVQTGEASMSPRDATDISLQ